MRYLRQELVTLPRTVREVFGTSGSGSSFLRAAEGGFSTVRVHGIDSYPTLR